MLTKNTTPATRPTAPANTPIAQAEKLLALYIQADNDVQALDERAAPLKALRAEFKAQLQEWAEAHGDQFGGTKTLKLAGGSIGFRAGLKAVVFPDPAAEKTPADILDRYLKIVREEAPAAIEEKVNSSQVIKAWGLLPALKKRLERLVLSIGQMDVFMVVPNKRNDHE